MVKRFKRFSKKGGWNLLLIDLTVFKLIIKGKDSNIKRKVGQRRHYFIAINFLPPKVKVTLVSRGKHSDTR